MYEILFCSSANVLIENYERQVNLRAHEEATAEWREGCHLKDKKG